MRASHAAEDTSRGSIKATRARLSGLPQRSFTTALERQAARYSSPLNLVWHSLIHRSAALWQQSAVQCARTCDEQTASTNCNDCQDWSLCGPSRATNTEIRVQVLIWSQSWAAPCHLLLHSTIGGLGRILLQPTCLHIWAKDLGCVFRPVWQQ